MSASVAQARLKEAHKLLLLRWARARDGWDDALRAQIEREAIEPLTIKLNQAHSAMTRLAELVNQTRQQCQ